MMAALTMNRFLRPKSEEPPAGAPPALSARTDQTLAQQARRGDPDAFGELVRRHQQAVFNVALRMTGSRPDAEDATQETFLRAFRAFKQFDSHRPLAPWLKRIAVNVCLNWYEANRIRPAVTEADLARPGEAAADLDEWQANVTTPEQRYLAREQAAAVRAAILQLPPAYRAVIELRHFQNLSYEEIATTLGRPLSSVKSDLFRARKQLAQVLAAENRDL